MARSTTSIFDSNTFLETTHQGKLDITFVLPDEGDYSAQITDKIEAVGGIIGEGKNRAGEPWCSINISWEIMDENVRQKLNMEHVIVRQGLMVDLVPGTGINGVPPQLDLGTNKNMRLKRLYEAVGLNKNAKLSPAMLKFQSGNIEVRHRDDDDDPTIKYAEVVRVYPSHKASVKQAAE